MKDEHEHTHRCPHCGGRWEWTAMICSATRLRTCWPCKTAGHDDPPPPGFGGLAA